MQGQHVHGMCPGQDLHEFQAILAQEEMLLSNFHSGPNVTGHSFQQQDGAILMMLQPIKDIYQLK
jgi:hypothetical protein